MTSKRYKEAIERERRRKNGVRRWQSEVDRFGSEVIPLIPRELKGAVIGVRIEEVTFAGNVVTRVPESVMDKLRKIAPERQGVNPHHQLEEIFRRRRGQ